MSAPAQQPAGTPSPEKQALLDAFDEVIKADAETRSRRPEHRRRRKWPVHPLAVLALLVLAGAGTYVGVTRPSWLFQRGMPPENASLQDASLRMGMAVQYQRIERYRKANGRLPDSLDQVGEPMQGITYERLPADQFVLRGQNGGISLELHSTDPVRDFVANSYTVVQRRGQR